jgi:hypothetical protein
MPGRALVKSSSFEWAIDLFFTFGSCLSNQSNPILFSKVRESSTRTCGAEKIERTLPTKRTDIKTRGFWGGCLPWGALLSDEENFALNFVSSMVFLDLRRSWKRRGGGRRRSGRRWQVGWRWWGVTIEVITIRAMIVAKVTAEGDDDKVNDDKSQWFIVTDDHCWWSCWSLTMIMTTIYSHRWLSVMMTDCWRW